MDNKTDLRLRAKSIRKELNIVKISNSIVYNIKQMSEYILSKHIMIYYPLCNEINLLPLVDDDSKCFYLPRIYGKEIECCPYNAGDDLILSPLNISEPVCEQVDKSEIELVFVPALMADKNFNRLGYGGGFYDRFLSDLNAYKMIPVPEELIVDELPVFEFDVCCDGIVTQKKASSVRG